MRKRLGKGSRKYKERRLRQYLKERINKTDLDTLEGYRHAISFNSKLGYYRWDFTYITDTLQEKIRRMRDFFKESLDNPDYMHHVGQERSLEQMNTLLNVMNIALGGNDTILTDKEINDRGIRVNPRNIKISIPIEEEGDENYNPEKSYSKCSIRQMKAWKIMWEILSNYLGEWWI